MKKQGSLSWFLYELLGCLDVLEYDGAHVRHHLFSGDFEEIVALELQFPFERLLLQFCLPQV